MTARSSKRSRYLVPPTVSFPSKANSRIPARVFATFTSGESSRLFQSNKLDAGNRFQRSRPFYLRCVCVHTSSPFHLVFTSDLALLPGHHRSSFHRDATRPIAL